MCRSMYTISHSLEEYCINIHVAVCCSIRLVLCWSLWDNLLYTCFFWCLYIKECLGCDSTWSCFVWSPTSFIDHTSSNIVWFLVTRQMQHILGARAWVNLSAINTTCTFMNLYCNSTESKLITTENRTMTDWHAITVTLMHETGANYITYTNDGMTTVHVHVHVVE